MVGRPLRIDLETKQVVQALHLLAQDLLAGLDTPISFSMGFQADSSLGRLLGSLVLTQGEAVVAFECDADFVAAGHGRKLPEQA
ncbi:hypothetical protein [Brevundimonas albigilva]|uniref:Uncharacterized protein n=1 Tax=Brevundimonas albigilva TaxID=1312364 RepID=A0ABY4SJ89_9CAUL|nr:hypothetical protein [Brevundimonas albigilva]URI14858.1 hypothetical protein M8231_13740 [Brevundimonas albigilva]